MGLPQEQWVAPGVEVSQLGQVFLLVVGSLVVYFGCLVLVLSG